MLRIDADLWNDEIYSIKKFILVDFNVTLSDYHVPNNHVFFNLINNLYLKCIGVDSLYTLLEKPYLIRILPFVYSILSALFLYLITKRLAGRKAAVLSVVVLVTTIPFFYFSLQIRGYGLSTMLLLMLTYFSIRYDSKKKIITLFWIALSSFLVFYTIPSNLYSILGILLFWGGKVWMDYRKETERSISTFFLGKSALIVYAIVGGLLVALAFYFPIFEQVFMNDYVKAGEYFQFNRLLHYMHHVHHGVLSFRFALLLFIGIGLFLSIKNKSKRGSVFILLMLCICLVPILAVFARGDEAPLRIFSVSLPFYAALIAVGLMSFWNRLKLQKGYFWFASAIILYCLVTFNMEITKIENRIYTDILKGNRSQNFYYQYYSAHFEPHKTVSDFYANYYDSNYPVVVTGCETHSLPHYLEAFNIKQFDSSHLDSLKETNDTIYIISHRPFEMTKDIEYANTFTSKKLSYHNITLHFKNKLFVDKMNERAAESHSTYKDSILYVISTNNNYKFKSPNVLFIKEKDPILMANLITQSEQFKYIYYFETVNRNSLLIKHNILETHSEIVVQEKNKNYSWFVSKKSALKTIESSLISSDFKDGYFELSSEIEVSDKYVVPNEMILPNSIIKITFDAKFDGISNGLVVMDIGDENENKSWNGNSINQYYNSGKEWNRVITTFAIPSLVKEDIVTIYVWHTDGKPILIKNFRIEILEDIY